MGSVRKRWQVTAWLFVSLSLLHWGCGGGGGGGGATRVLSGTVTEDNFVVGADERVACQGDVTIQCQTADITGQLYAVATTDAGANGSSITVEATGDIAVTGSIAAGAGAAGNTNGAGGNGGSVTVRSTGGDITLGTAATRADEATPVLASGAGANGGDGTLGGAGGNGGDVVIEAPEGTIAIHPQAGMFVAGNGGHGGDGSVEGDALNTFELPEELQLTNGGGDSGVMAMTAAAVTGFEDSTTFEPDEGEPIVFMEFDVAIVGGGIGGDAGSFRYNMAGVDEETLSGAERSTAQASRQYVSDTLHVDGAYGGSGVYAGGRGGNVEERVLTPGAGVRAAGGPGGSVQYAHLSHSQWIPTYWLFSLRGGDGGWATAIAANGVNGGPGQPGQDGGSATALGGDGADPFRWTNLASFGQQHLAERAIIGAGGAAVAVAGKGGDGGSGCESRASGPGGAGGKGGNADASGGQSRLSGNHLGTVSRGGNAKALAGNGGDGGSGRPAGVGSAGGVARAAAGEGIPAGQVIREQNGRPGDGGAACQDPEPQPQAMPAVVVDAGSSSTNWTFPNGTALSPKDKVVMVLATCGLTSDRGRADTLTSIVTLGGSSHPIHPNTGQTLTMNAALERLWCVTGATILCYRDPLDGGDRAPTAVLTATTAGVGGFNQLAYDDTRDILYVSSTDGKLLAWQGAASLSSDRAPDRTLTSNAIERFYALVVDPAANRLFAAFDPARDQAQDWTRYYQVAVFDNISTASRAVAPARVLQVNGSEVAGLAYDATRNLLYVGRTVSFTDNDVVVVANASTANGAVNLTQLTGLDADRQVICLSVDAASDLLFARSIGRGFYVLREAHSASGADAFEQSQMAASGLATAVLRQPAD